MNTSERTIPAYKGNNIQMQSASVVVGYEAANEHILTGCELEAYLNRKLTQIRYQMHLAQREENSWALCILKRMERETITKLDQIN